MALDSLLAMRKTGVSGVSQVQANNGGLFADTPADSAKVSGVSGKRIAPGADTSDTPCNPMRYQAKPLLLLACTPDTSDTSQNTNAEESAACFGWLIHFLDRDPMYVTFSPEVDHAGAMASYPDAVAAEPMPCAVAVAVPLKAHDDRITCRQCANLTYAGACSVASPGAVVSAVKGYRPAPDLLQRCGAFNQKGTK